MKHIYIYIYWKKVMKKSRINVLKTFIHKHKGVFFDHFGLKLPYTFFFFFQSISLFHKDLGFFLFFMLSSSCHRLVMMWCFSLLIQSDKTDSISRMVIYMLKN